MPYSTALQIGDIGNININLHDQAYMQSYYNIMDDLTREDEK
jgi:hypothetical protein